MRFWRFQCSSASRKFLNRLPCSLMGYETNRFSALQRAENSSTLQALVVQILSLGFSALQRAENSSTSMTYAAASCTSATFQCSSASRKFLNMRLTPTRLRLRAVSVLFSEPKIPQPWRAHRHLSTPATVSVLFSEPKIPQPTLPTARLFECAGFSALQRAENSSTPHPLIRPLATVRRFSALQRAENSSTIPRGGRQPQRHWFQCSSASRKFLNSENGDTAALLVGFQCSSASRKFLNHHRILLE